MRARNKSRVVKKSMKALQLHLPYLQSRDFSGIPAQSGHSTLIRFEFINMFIFFKGSVGLFLLPKIEH